MYLDDLRFLHIQLFWLHSLKLLGFSAIKSFVLPLTSLLFGSWWKRLLEGGRHVELFTCRRCVRPSWLHSTDWLKRQVSWWHQEGCCEKRDAKNTVVVNPPFCEGQPLWYRTSVLSSTEKQYPIDSWESSQSKAFQLSCWQYWLWCLSSF